MTGDMLNPSDYWAMGRTGSGTIKTLIGSWVSDIREWVHGNVT